MRVIQGKVSCFNIATRSASGVRVVASYSGRPMSRGVDDGFCPYRLSCLEGEALWFSVTKTYLLQIQRKPNVS